MAIKILGYRLLLLGTAFGLLAVPGAWASNEDTSLEYLLKAAAPVRTEALEQRPNVLFIIVDDLNVAIGAYLESAPSPQYVTAKTPNIDRLAEQGIRLDRAYVQNPLCNPSRSSLLSGLRPSTLDVYSGSTPPRHRVGDQLRMLPEHFHDHGYFTARVGKVGHNTFEHAFRWDVSSFALSREPAIRFHVPGYLPGIDRSTVRDHTWREGSKHGMSRAEVLAPVALSRGLPLSWRATNESPRMTPDGTTATRIVQLMAENRDKPFFIAAGFHKPHQPWVGPVEFFEQHPIDEVRMAQTPEADTADIPDPAFEIRLDDAEHTEREQKQAIAAYHAMVTMTDSYVGEVIQGLGHLGLADSTIVVLTSDHGFQLGEHGGLWRTSVQFEESTRVPLIVRLPDGRNASEVATGLVELVDLYPTLVDLANLPEPAHELEGTSFAALLSNPDRVWKSAVFSESHREGHHGRTIRTQRYRYTEWTPLQGAEGELRREFYDLQKDPFEHDNLATDPEHRGLLEDMSSQLHAGWQAALPQWQ